jgi:cytosine permease
MLSVESTAPKLNNRLLIVFTGTLGTVAAFFNILDYFLDFLFYLAVVFVPVSGVIAVDYLSLRREAYHELREVMEASLRKSAVIAWALGACVALVGSWGWIALSGIAAIDAMLVAAFSYYLFSRFTTTSEELTGPDAEVPVE